MAALLHKQMVISTREGTAKKKTDAVKGNKKSGAAGKEEVSITCHAYIHTSKGVGKKCVLAGMSDGAILMWNLARDPVDDAWQRQVEDKKPKRFHPPSNGHKGSIHQLVYLEASTLPLVNPSTTTHRPKKGQPNPNPNPLHPRHTSSS